ncbi:MULTISPECIES: DUF2970 domain-containing protein [Roseateles]|uniref:DUF2970 domain-containing protein n=1 Tax=Pelomonas aquatica TaxID=431058 RepID=A0ABU1Z4X7_9BURK|nr:MULTISPECIES: DUF2970 domain-containing protein [Roseateles]KQY86453.1 hypothetical protein ASD35_19910 [Pelomonas sp. Root1444]MDR7295674.1 hypothetical protein [Pelomonas aquatica]
MSKPGQDLKDAVGRKASLRQTISAVAWGFFGVRRGKDHEQDIAKLNPVHVLIAGVLGAALFVLVLVLVVRWVIGSGVAGA